MGEAVEAFASGSLELMNSFPEGCRIVREGGESTGKLLPLSKLGALPCEVGASESFYFYFF